MSKTAIIGGGVAGLSAGIYTLLSGGEAIILESHTSLGGNLTGWDRGGYRIDNCIHWLTGTNPESAGYKIWCDLGALGGVRVHQPEILYSYELGGERVSLFRDIDKTEEHMIGLSPEDEGEIRRLISAAKLLQRFLKIGGKSHNEGLTASEKIKRAPTLLAYHTISTSALAKRFKSPLLRGFISCFIGGDFTALALLGVFAAFTADNGGIPEGGSVAMTDRLANRFLTLGGELRLGRAVTRINIEDKRAVSISLSDGSVIPCDYVVITPEPRAVFGRLLNSEMPPAIKRLYKNGKAYRFSSIHSAFAVDCESLGFSGDLILEIPAQFRPLLNAKNIILREFSHEKSFAPKGKNVIQAMIFVDEDMAAAFVAMRNSKEAYKSHKKLIGEITEEIISDRFPELSGKLTCLDVWTPATYNRYTASEVGSYMSFIFPPMTVPPRVKNKLPEYRNIYLATQWATLPGGLPNAAAEGKRCAAAIAAAEAAKEKKSKSRVFGAIRA